MAGLFVFIIACLIVVCAHRGLRKRAEVNYDVAEIDPDWDVDQVRVYYIRRLQRQLQQNRDLQAEEAADLERQLKEQKNGHAREFLDALEDIIMDSKA